MVSARLAGYGCMAMNFALKVIVLVAAGVVLVLLGVGMLLPSRWQVDSTQVIAAPRERVLGRLQDLASWPQWSTFRADLGPNTRLQAEGQAGTAGQRLVWSGAQGQAVLQLTRCDPEGVDYEFSMVSAGEAAPTPLGHGVVRVRPRDDGAEVSWRDEHELDSIALRWFAWFGALQEAVRRIQQTSLEGLRQGLVPDGAGPPKK